MRFSAKTAALAVLASAGLSVAYYWYGKPDRIPVTLYRVTSGPVEATVSNTRVGTVKACRRAYLAPGTGGEVVVLNVTEGDQVEQGEILLEVWNEGLKARIDLIKAEIKSKLAAAEQACFSAAGSERAAQRLVNLKKHEGLVSEELVDLAVTKASAEKARCLSARAAVNVSKASLDVARSDVKRTQITAPFDGTIAEINAELGEFVTPSPPGIPTLPPIDLLDTSCLFVSAPIDEVDAPKIETGMQACILLDAFGDKRCSGKVTRIAPYVLEREKQARTVEVEVELLHPGDREGLLPGYSADIEIVLERREKALRVPAEAVFNNRVLVFRDDGLLVEREISPGLSNWNYIEILKGLQEGERIVLNIGEEGVAAGVFAEEQPAGHDQA